MVYYSVCYGLTAFCVVK